MTTATTRLTAPTATIDLDALAANYRTIGRQLGPVPAAAVVKADGYGIGAAAAATTLWAEGCRRFFVARASEGVELRATLPDAEINVFDGLIPGTADDLVGASLVPMLNSLRQVEGWADAARSAGRPLPAGLHLDTGMRRLGLPPVEVSAVLDHPELLAGLEVRHVLSHLASADVDGSPQSAQQLAAFRRLRSSLPMGAASLANSAGIFLGPDYHFDLARPGISLYGGSPFPDSGRANPMRTVVTVEAPIIQVRAAEPGETVGYGATHRVERPALIATVPVGYADGYLRSSSNNGLAAVGGCPVPVVGRISMDLITIDVTGLAPELVEPGAPVELLGPSLPIDEVAERAGSIPHELLTNMGRRLTRRFVGGPTEAHSH